MDNQTDTQVLNEGEEYISYEQPEAQEDNESDETFESNSNNQYRQDNPQLYARVKKAEQRVKELEKIVSSGTNSQVTHTSKDMERIELIARGYDDDAISSIQKYGGVSALKDEVIVEGLKARKEKLEREAKAVNNISGKSGVSKSYTQQDVARMTADEYTKAFRL